MRTVKGPLLVIAPRSVLSRRGVVWINRLPPPDLTPRQTEVLRWMASGLRTKEIAAKMKVSVKTVETHRLLLTRRLGIRDLPRLLRHALRTGILPPSWLLEAD